MTTDPTPTGEVAPMTDEDAEILLDRHGPWSYTEYGVLCICGDAMDKNEDCAALRVLAERDRLRTELDRLRTELATTQAERDTLRDENERLRAGRKEMRDSLVDCLHVIGGQWTRWVPDTSVWPRLKSLRRFFGVPAIPLTSGEQQFVYGDRAYHRAQNAVDVYDFEETGHCACDPLIAHLRDGCAVHPESAS